MSNVIDMDAWLGRKTDPDELDDEPEYQLDADCAVYTVPEAARRIGRSVGTTYELLRSGEIPAFRLGSRWTIPRSTFDDWLNSRAKKEVG